MSSEIRQYVESCDICATYADKQAPETLSLHPVPDLPWEKIGTDLFQIEGRDYLLTVDYHSGFFETDYLSETSSEMVISKLKQHCARYGIPNIIISDGGPQYTSEKFHKFCREWGISHQRSSPGNSKANGAAEAAVKTAKRMMKKCHAGKEDPYLGLLNLRNTPTEGLQFSPAQRLLGRKTNTIIPSSMSTADTPDKNQKEKLKARTAERQDEHRKDLKKLQIGDTVRMQPIERGKEKWRQTRVSSHLKPRTYEVTADNGRKYIRNRQFLRNSQPPTEPQMEHEMNSATGQTEVQQPPIEPQVGVEPTSTLYSPRTESPRREETTAGTAIKDTLYKTRSGRSVKPVQKLTL